MDAGPPRADDPVEGTAPSAAIQSAAMQLGQKVIHDGRELVLRGLDPMSVIDGRAELEDPETGDRELVPIVEVEPAPRAGDVSARLG